MHSLLRHQTQAVKFCTHTSTNSGNATTMLPPVLICHKNGPWQVLVFKYATSVRCRVTLYRRVAELNFRGVDFRALPKDASRHTGTNAHADPAYWLYGLSSNCAKACESKIEATNGIPVWKAKEEEGTPTLKPQANLSSCKRS